MSSIRSALVVAADRYDDPKLARLQAPRRDAQALADVLNDPAIGGFDVDLALNCPEGEVRRRLSRFFADRGRDDLLLVHFSCHGLKNESGGLYFAAPDTEVAHLDVTAISAELVNRLMTRSRSRRIVLLLDCCYGGAFSRGLGRRAGESVDVQEPLSGSGRVVLTASNAMEYSYEGEELRGQGSPSVFTAAIVRGLRTGEADMDGDQQVSVDELYDYVYQAVRRDTPHMTPSRFGLVEGRMIIARNPRPLEPAPLPEDLALAMRSASSDVREGAVRGLARLLGDSDARVVASARAALETMGGDDSRLVSAAATAALGDTSTRTPAAPAVVPRRPAAIASRPATAPIVLVALTGILVALSSVLGFYGDKNLFQLFDVITGGTVLFGLAGTLGCGLAAAALAVLSRDPLAVLLLGGAAFGAVIGALDFNYVNYVDISSLNDLEGHDLPTGIELALLAAPALWGAGLWLLLRRTEEVAARARVSGWDAVAAGAGLLLGLLLLVQALGVGEELVVGELLLPVIAAAPIVALALRPRVAWPSAVVMSLGASGASYALVGLAAYGIGDLIVIALSALIAIAGARSFRERTG